MTETMKRHGLFVGIERVGTTFFMSFKAKGKLTHEDYEIITPMIDRALEGVKDPKIRCLADLTELDGWELRAAWDDLKLGLKHGREFAKCAIVGNKPWEKVAARVGAWFTAGEVRYFEDTDEALNWLHDLSS